MNYHIFYANISSHLAPIVRPGLLPANATELLLLLLLRLSPPAKFPSSPAQLGDVRCVRRRR